MSTTKLNPKAVLNIANDIYAKLTSAKTATDNLYKSIKNSATGNAGKSYWNGNRAFNWYCNSLRNCANDYYRIYKIASCYKSMCKSAQNAIMKDGQMIKSERSTYDGLGAKYAKFATLMTSCESARNVVIKFGQS